MNFVYLKFLSFCQKILNISVLLLFSLDPTMLTEEQVDYQSHKRILRSISLEELKALAHDPVNDISLDFVKSLDSENLQCYGSFVSSRLCSYLFFSRNTASVSKYIDTEIPKNHAYCYKVFTLPDCRHQGFFKELLLFSMRREMAVRRGENFFVYIYADNLISIKTFNNIGFKMKGLSLVFRNRFPVNFLDSYLIRNRSNRMPAPEKLIS